MRFYYFAVIITGLMVLMNLGGITTPVTSTIINTLDVNMTQGGEKFSVSSSELVDQGDFSLDPRDWGLLQILGAIAITGVVVSLIGFRSPDVNLIAGAFIGGITILLIIDLSALANILLSINIGWIKGVAFIIFIPMSFGLIISAITYFLTGD